MTQVVIYTRHTCGFCVRAKMLLQQKQIDFTEISIDDFPDKRTEMIERSHGRTTVPQIFINEQPIGGCDDLFALHYNGRLDALLNE
ncbi:glutaredoxin 3 [Thalassotalea ponticola]|uniref:glutaredoxin 3 n=1 Tax=Thalassotalea ponticola TaxID=1523392 RepID=UPI0025B3703D|nr:glutaredoxin 3 [Thalassotalea ponticola]MDN3652404.1 glutaredoxin 3 [Thalassotalea ponticola]